MLYRLSRDQYLLEIGIATRPRQPFIAGPEGVADMEQHRYLPKAVVADELSAK